MSTKPKQRRKGRKRAETRVSLPSLTVTITLDDAQQRALHRLSAGVPIHAMVQDAVDNYIACLGAEYIPEWTDAGRWIRVETNGAPMKRRRPQQRRDDERAEPIQRRGNWINVGDEDVLPWIKIHYRKMCSLTGETPRDAYNAARKVWLREITLGLRRHATRIQQRRQRAAAR